jgi:L-aminopeptidase/D-esterase-like protein
VNAFGDVIHPQTGQIIAGVRSPADQQGKGFFADTMLVMNDLAGKRGLGFAASKEHTVIGVVATNARMNKEQITKVSQMAHDGLARTVSPAHTMLDGDTIFALSYGEIEADVNIIGAFAARVFSEAMLRAVYTAQGDNALPAVCDLPGEHQVTWSGYDR